MKSGFPFIKYLEKTTKVHDYNIDFFGKSPYNSWYAKRNLRERNAQIAVQE